MRIAIAVAVVVGALTVSALVFVSARTAESGCVAEAERRGLDSIHFDGWSWWPPGTSCTLSSDRPGAGEPVTETRLFW